MSSCLAPGRTSSTTPGRSGKLRLNGMSSLSDMACSYLAAFVMPGLVPGIHVLRVAQDVDGRDKPGHDDVGEFSFRGRSEKRLNARDGAAQDQGMDVVGAL